MFSSTSFAEWKKVSTNVDGDTFYVDFERIRKHDGYVYWWELFDYLKPDKTGVLSGKVYKQGDCKLIRFKGLSFSYHKEPMADTEHNGSILFQTFLLNTEKDTRGIPLVSFLDVISEWYP